ncbi:MAG: spore cortex biosynthesis protein YabQ [Acetatifactor sp.]
MVSENEFLFHALLLGWYFTFVYDLLRIFRRVVYHNTFLVSLEDLGFWIYCGAEVFLLMHHESNGTLRWFAVMGALTGILVYKKLISPYFVKYASMWLQKLVKMLATVFRWMTLPLRRLARKTERSAKRAGSKLRIFSGRIRKQIKNRLTYFMKMIKISFKK